MIEGDYLTGYFDNERCIPALFVVMMLLNRALISHSWPYVSFRPLKSLERILLPRLGNNNKFPDM